MGILDGMTNADVIDAVQEKVGGAIPILDTDVTTNPEDITTAGSGDTITVTVQVNFADVSWLPEALWLGGKRLSASSAMRRETVQ